jgi:2-methylaconitate cis-trans-isomerase PrpF
LASPDSRQIDGLGGATSTTSKLMIVGESDEKGIDAEFTFGQVSVDKRVVDYGGTCGNLTFGIRPFAIDEGIVVNDEATEVTLTLYNTNTDSCVEQTIPVEAGATRTKGEFKVPCFTFD